MDGIYINFQRGVVGEWPADGAGEPQEPAFLEHKMCSEAELALEQNMLWAFGVPSVSRYPKDGALGKVVLGESGYGIDIYVPISQLEDARNVISADHIDPDNNNEEED